MKKFSLAMLCILSIPFSGIALAKKSSQVDEVVIGNNDFFSDRQAIQNAIDNAPGDTPYVIQLEGTFQLDGGTISIRKSNITLQGKRLCNKKQLECYSTILNGLYVLGENIPGPIQGSNRGIDISGDDGLVENVVVKDMVMSGHVRTISLDGQGNGSNFCLFATTNEGTKNVEVKDMFITFSDRGPQNFGKAENFTFSGNVMEDILGIGMILSGGTEYECYQFDGEAGAPTSGANIPIPIVEIVIDEDTGETAQVCQSLSTFTLYPPYFIDLNSDGEFEPTCVICDEDVDPGLDDNQSCDPASGKLIVWGNAVNGKVIDNKITMEAVAFRDEETGQVFYNSNDGFTVQRKHEDVLIKNNVITGGNTVVNLLGENKNVLLTNNSILNGGVNYPSSFQGGGLAIYGSGYTVKNNLYSGNIWDPNDFYGLGGVADRGFMDIMIFNSDGQNEVSESSCVNVYVDEEASTENIIEINSNKSCKPKR